MLTLKKRNTNNITTLLEYKDNIELVYANNHKKRYYPPLANLMVDYKEQVLIISIKTNIQCSICHILLKKKELGTWSFESWIYQSN